MSSNRIEPTVELGELSESKKHQNDEELFSELKNYVEFELDDSKSLEPVELAVIKENKADISSSIILEKLTPSFEKKPAQQLKIKESSPVELLDAAIEAKRLQIKSKMLKLFPASRIYDRWDLYCAQANYVEFESARLEEVFRKEPTQVELQELKSSLLEHNELIKKMKGLLSSTHTQSNPDVSKEEPEETPERLFAKQLLELLQSDYLNTRYRF